MENYIIGAIILVAVAIGLTYTVRHFRGKGGCCGGGGYRLRAKRLPRILYKKTFSVADMHCDRCKARVTEAVNDIPGLSGRVDLKKGTLTVSYAEPVEDEVLRTRLERIGYRVTDIR